MELTKFKFGRDDLLLHVSSALLALFVFYSVVFIANLLKIPFYLGYKKYIINITVLSVEADRILWVGSIILFPSINVLRRLKNVKSLKVILDREMLILSLFYGMLILMAIEIASLACWIYNLFHPSLPFSDERWHLAFTEVQLTNILYPALPVLLMFFSYSWIGEFTFKGLLIKSGDVKARNVESTIPFRSFKISMIIILFSVLSALFIGYYNYAAAGAYNSSFLGVDVPHYVKDLNYMLNSSVSEAFSYASRNDRFLYLVFQYLCFQVSGSSPEVFVGYYMPVILTILLMISTFLLVSVRGLLQASTAMLVTVFSFQVTVGFYAGFFANWFALTFLYIFYGLLTRVLKGKNRSPFMLVLSAVSSVTVLYTHPWTWILLVMMILSAYLVTTLLLVYFRRKDIHDYLWELKFLATLLAFNLVMFYVKGLLNIGGGARIGGYVNVKTFKPSVWNAFLLKHFLDRTFNWYVGGFYAYAPTIILAILGILSFLDYENRYNMLLLNWMLVASAMIIVDFPWQARFLYLTPFNIYVSLGILQGAEQISKIFKTKNRGCAATVIFWTFYLLSILLLINYTVRCISIKQFGPTGLTLKTQS